MNKDVQLSRQLYRYNETTKVWDLIADGTVLKIADKIKVVLTIETSKALQYVFIDDKRAGALEPVESKSGYQYANGFSYYESVRDVGSQFFTDYIPSGKWEIIYELKVAQQGEFTGGPATLQCMYKPEINAYSNSNRINIK